MLSISSTVPGCCYSFDRLVVIRGCFPTEDLRRPCGAHVHARAAYGLWLVNVGCCRCFAKVLVLQTHMIPDSRPLAAGTGSYADLADLKQPRMICGLNTLCIAIQFSVAKEACPWRGSRTGSLPVPSVPPHILVPLFCIGICHAHVCGRPQLAFYL